MAQDKKPARMVKTLVWSKGRKPVVVGDTLKDVVGAGREWKLKGIDVLGERVTLHVNDGKAKRDKPFAVDFFRDVEVVEIAEQRKKPKLREPAPPAPTVEQELLAKAEA